MQFSNEHVLSYFYKTSHSGALCSGYSLPVGASEEGRFPKGGCELWIRKEPGY